MSDEWQDIETAPKDGTPVLLFADGYPCIGRYYPAMEAWSDTDDILDTDIYNPHEIQIKEEMGYWREEIQPTHWMPLPAPPTVT